MKMRIARSAHTQLNSPQTVPTGNHQFRYTTGICLLLLCVPTICQSQDNTTVQETAARVIVRDRDGERTVEGRLVVQAQDGGLLIEESNGRLQIIPSAAVQSREQLEDPFRYLTADDMARYLQNMTGPEFQIHRTEHYVVCSAANEEYTEFCGRLLELVYSEFYEEFGKLKTLQLRAPPTLLPVVIFATTNDFSSYARRQHPEVDFTDTPGYYTIRDNQVLLLDLTGDRSMRNQQAIRKRLSEMPLQVATVVHECVHQLAFNSGLQIRLADNPLWLSEGIALWFEQGAPRAALLWSRPGQVNARLHPIFVQQTRSGQMNPDLATLLSSDQLHQDPATAAGAYAESWGLVAWLMRTERDGFEKYLKIIGERRPLVPVSTSTRISEFETSIGKSSDEIGRQLIPFVTRLRPPR